MKTVLLVDDDVAVLNLTGVLLEREGYDVLCACDGREALSLSRQYPGEIDLLLTDVEMPNMDGLTLAEQVTRERPRIKVLVMSGKVSVGGRWAYLRKPFLPTDLIEAVRRLVA